ncbi:uncharacterized protein CLAFUR5_04723 [Fulvia fulva]|uniref:N-acetyltransferase domain-containing protein n=1 Tax=Passalora fulva TaxID=5499 RepID=A0A9Q8P7Q3_PASFU|nr:uncharacterized protein CLAFUR5_04723 [Fulvia fulva]UJO16112.1 hypothetical protein CLAFUR5_04723 [Fulvia fulva]
MADLETTSATKGDTNILEYKEKTATLLSEIFISDPVIRFMLSGLDDTTRLSYMHEYFSALTKAAMLNNATFQEASSWTCVAIWLPPGKKVDNPLTILQAGILQAVLKLGFNGIKKMLWDYQGQAEALKKKELEKERFWYLFFIATVVEARGKGLATGVVEGWKGRARADGVPVWLEATTERSRGIYERCGFRVAGEVVLGRGTHSRDGVVEKGGPGVRVWGMVWRPEEEEVKAEESKAV